MSLNKNIGEAFLHGKKCLLEKGVEDAAFVARLFLSETTGLSMPTLLANADKLLLAQELSNYEEMLLQRCLGKPTQYILGKWEFMGIPFLVKEGVLIPRGDTEILVEAILEKAKLKPICHVLDLGTGTGCIPISLAVHGKMKPVAVDINPLALELAEQNAVLNDVNNIKWYEGDLFAALPKEYRGKFDAIVSNPPYIRTDDLQGLMPEVRDFEPRLALDGGADGLDFYRRIVAEAVLWLADEAFLFFEIGFDQGADVRKLMEQEFMDLEIIKDLAGLDRVVMGRRKVLDEVQK